MVELTPVQLSRLRQEYERALEHFLLRQKMHEKTIQTWGENPTAAGPRMIVEDSRQKLTSAERAYDAVVAQL